jgi:hypothetical protein
MLQPLPFLRKYLRGVGSPGCNVENNKVITLGNSRHKPSFYTDIKYEASLLRLSLWGGRGGGVAAPVCILHLFPYTGIGIK